MGRTGILCQKKGVEQQQTKTQAVGDHIGLPICRVLAFLHGRNDLDVDHLHSRDLGQWLAFLSTTLRNEGLSASERGSWRKISVTLIDQRSKRVMAVLDT
jgi:hypothetical protein